MFSSGICHQYVWGVGGGGPLPSGTVTEFLTSVSYRFADFVESHLMLNNVNTHMSSFQEVARDRIQLWRIKSFAKIVTLNENVKNPQAPHFNVSGQKEKNEN